MSLVINEEYKGPGGTKARALYTIDPSTGKRIKLTDSHFADQVLKAREKGPWEVMDLLIEHWASTNPGQYNSFIINVEIEQGTRGTKYGQGKRSSSLRFTLDIPERVILLFRTIYKPDEFFFDDNFKKKFWERYPQFRVAERL